MFQNDYDLAEAVAQEYINGHPVGWNSNGDSISGKGSCEYFSPETQGNCAVGLALLIQGENPKEIEGNPEFLCLEGKYVGHFFNDAFWSDIQDAHDSICLEAHENMQPFDKSISKAVGLKIRQVIKKHKRIDV